MSKQFVVVLDNQCFGPFSTENQATSYSDTLKDGFWATILPLKAPKKGKKR